MKKETEQILATNSLCLSLLDYLSEENEGPGIVDNNFDTVHADQFIALPPGNDFLFSPCFPRKDKSIVGLSIAERINYLSVFCGLKLTRYKA